MEEDEVEKRLREQAPGYFLIRFSISRADSGFFVLAVKVDGDVIQVQVEVSTRVVLIFFSSVVLFYFIVSFFTTYQEHAMGIIDNYSPKWR